MKRTPTFQTDSILNDLTFEKCEIWAHRWPDNILVAKDGDRVAEFVAYGKYRDDELTNAGEIFAIYILSEFYGTGIGFQLMQAGIRELNDYSRIAVWVLKENEIRFYEKCGFRSDGREETIQLGSPVVESRLILER